MPTITISIGQNLHYEIEELITFTVENQTIEFNYIGHGSYNVVYLSNEAFEYPKGSDVTCQWVYRQIISVNSENKFDEQFDQPERLLRLWKSINPEKFAHAFNDSWLCPYFGDKTPSDKDISDEVIDIYIRTKRVVIDACGRKNFLHLNDGEAICIDVGLALSADSPRSQLYWGGNHSLYDDFWVQSRGPHYTNPQTSQIHLNYRYRALTVEAIKALKLLDETGYNFTDECLNILKDNKTLCKKLAMKYSPKFPADQKAQLRQLKKTLNELGLTWRFNDSTFTASSPAAPAEEQIPPATLAEKQPSQKKSAPETPLTEDTSCVMISTDQITAKSDNVTQALACLDKFLHRYKTLPNYREDKLQSVVNFCTQVKIEINSLSQIPEDQFDDALIQVLVIQTDRHFTRDNIDTVLRLIADVFLIPLTVFTGGLALATKYLYTGHCSLFSHDPTERKIEAFRMISSQERPGLLDFK